MAGLASRVEVVTGDLLTVEADLIVHQCNCVTKRAKGLAAALFAAFPEADVYALRKAKNKRGKSRPGTVSIHGRVVNLYAQ